ncbi:MAG: class I SAM-dependent methyltransferase [Gaiellaceae bacterium]
MTTRRFLVRATAAAGYRLTRLSRHLEPAPPAGAGAHSTGRTLAGDREIEWTWTLAHVRRASGRVLDFGSGNGMMALGAAFAGNDVVAVDLEPEQYAFHPDGIDYVQGDLNALPLEQGSFDQIVNCSTVEHAGLAGRYGSVDDAEADLRAMEKMSSLLKPGGDMVLTIPVGRDAVYAPLHRIYGQERLPRLLEHWEIREERYFAKPRDNRFEPVTRDDALAETGSASYYGLGLFVVVPR